jgi:2-amino-4-hydroxy-6-hydroxymethyldihydropteridine diphosphokinase
VERGLVGYLGLGSNEGDRLENLRAARDALAAHGVEVLASSSVYETAPQGEVLYQPDFLNAVLRVRTARGPVERLDAAKAV